MIITTSWYRTETEYYQIDNKGRVWRYWPDGLMGQVPYDPNVVRGSLTPCESPKKKMKDRRPLNNKTYLKVRSLARAVEQGDNCYHPLLDWIKELVDTGMTPMVAAIVVWEKESAR